MSDSIFHQGLVCPLDKNNVDTDQIIPKQFLTSVERDGFDKALFYDWRYLDNEQANPDFVLNEPKYQGASILLTRENFGCGSSREHAPWALKQYGFQVIIAPSFADIFYNNAINNQIVPAKVSLQDTDKLFQLTLNNQALTFKVDLEQQKIWTDESTFFHFDIAEDVRDRLLKNLDFIGVTEQFSDEIANFENTLLNNRPWQ